MLDDYLLYTSSQESPTIFHKWVFLTLVSSCLERNVWLSRGYYNVFPNLYTFLIADSAEMRKSTAIEIGKELLSKVKNYEVTMFEGQVTLPQMINKLGGTRLDPITGKQVPNSRFLLLAPELAVFLSGQEAPDKIQFLTDFFTGKTKPWRYETKTQGCVEINSPCINMLAASTSEWLAKGMSIGDFGGGFMGRCVFVVPSAARKRIAHPSVSAAQQQAFDRLVGKLQQLRTLRGEYQLSESGKTFFEYWYNNQPPIANTNRLKSYYERRPELILKLGIIKCTMDEGLEVTGDNLQWAVGALAEVETEMMTAFQFIGTDENVLAELVIAHLKGTGGSEQFVKLLSHAAPRLRTVQQFESVLRMLKEQERIKEYTRNNARFISLTDQQIAVGR
jgi:hypothetical protein